MNMIFLIGGPCSGKTTIAKDIINARDAVYLSTGDIVREIAKTNEAMAESIKYGRLAPEHHMDEMTLSKLMYLSKRDRDVVIDGYPRYFEQLFDIVTYLGDVRKFFYFVEATYDEMQERDLQRGRVDNTESQFRNRFRIFQERTMPMVKLLQSRDEIISVDSDTTILQLDLEEHRAFGNGGTWANIGFYTT